MKEKTIKKLEEQLHHLEEFIEKEKESISCLTIEEATLDANTNRYYRGRDLWNQLVSFPAKLLQNQTNDLAIDRHFLEILNVSFYKIKKEEYPRLKRLLFQDMLNIELEDLDERRFQSSYRYLFGKKAVPLSKRLDEIFYYQEKQLYIPKDTEKKHIRNCKKLYEKIVLKVIFKEDIELEEIVDSIIQETIILSNLKTSTMYNDLKLHHISRISTNEEEKQKLRTKIKEQITYEQKKNFLLSSEDTRMGLLPVLLKGNEWEKFTLDYLKKTQLEIEEYNYEEKTVSSLEKIKSMKKHLKILKNIHERRKAKNV